MTAAYHQLYVHLVWATFDRLPFIAIDAEARLHAVIAERCRKRGCEAVTVGGIEDHVHVLARIPVTLAVSELAQQAKGASSYFMNHEVRLDHAFKWQSGYGAFTVSKRGVPAAAAYVMNQREHHDEERLIEAFEATGDTAPPSG